MERRALIYFFIILIFAGLACNLPGVSNEDAGQVNENEVAEVQEVDLEVQEEVGADTSALVPGGQGELLADSESEKEQTAEEPAPQPTDETEPETRLPVGIREGLASLNSYQLTMTMINNGPTEIDREESVTIIRASVDDDARFMSTDTLSSSAEFPEIEQSVEDQYQLGLKTCTLYRSDGSVDVSTEEMTPLTRDMLDATSNLFDINITIGNPELVGTEMVNGVETGHYTFQVAGLGDYSGEEVTKADGEYWLALDGQYLVKYNLILEVRSAPEGDSNAEVMHSEYRYDLQQINEPMSITMPPECSS